MDRTLLIEMHLTRFTSFNNILVASFTLQNYFDFSFIHSFIKGNTLHHFACFFLHFVRCMHHLCISIKNQIMQLYKNGYMYTVLNGDWLHYPSKCLRVLWYISVQLTESRRMCVYVLTFVVFSNSHIQPYLELLNRHFEPSCSFHFE